MLRCTQQRLVFRSLRTRRANVSSSQSFSALPSEAPGKGSYPRDTAYHPTIDFSDAKAVYGSKPTSELLRAFVVLNLCRIRPLVENSEFLIKTGNAVLGKSIMNAILRRTFFGHFCAGETQDGIRPTVEKLKASQVGSILDYAAEADEGGAVPPGVEPEVTAEDAVDGTITERFPTKQAVARTYHYSGEDSCDAHVDVFERCESWRAPLLGLDAWAGRAPFTQL